MARGPEGAFWKKVRRAWPGHAVRIEASDGEVPAGTPDTVLSIDYRGGFVELKVWPDPCSSVQLVWHEDAQSRGAYAMVLAELPMNQVWLGHAKEWNRAIAERRYPDGATDLLDALDVIACALSGNGGKSHGMVRRSAKGRTRGAKA